MRRREEFRLFFFSFFFFRRRVFFLSYFGKGFFFLVSFLAHRTRSLLKSNPFFSSLKQWVDPPALPTGEEKEKDQSSSHRRNRKGHSKRRSLRAAFSRLFGWLVTVVTVPDAVILESAGLDALVLTWCFKLGMQVREEVFFFPRSFFFSKL